MGPHRRGKWPRGLGGARVTGTLGIPSFGEALLLGSGRLWSQHWLCSALPSLGLEAPRNDPVPESACSTTGSTSPQGSLGGGVTVGRGESTITHRGHLFDLDPEDGPGAWTISTLLNSTDPIAV